MRWLLAIPLMCLALAGFVTSDNILAQTQNVPARKLDRDERMRWWRDAKFGMFVHWGLYSGLAGTWDGKPVGASGGMEWIQQRVGADTDTYAEHAIPLFQPKPDFASEWAAVAKRAGARYVVFTTKHHDGFALHDSHVTEFDAGSVLRRDLVREIVEALRSAGLRVGFYYSVIDWHHNQYEYARSQQLPHPLHGKPYPNARSHERYVTDMHKQVDELTSNYGPVDVIWWDYSAIDFQGDEAWRSSELIRAVRAKHPNVIMNNRLFRKPEAGFVGMGMEEIALQLEPQYGDFITPEQHVPEIGIPNVDWETCMTMNTTWGYSAHDRAWKAERELIQTLIDAVSKGGNFLLNIGPRGDGSIPEPSIKSMNAIGTWLASNGESIYGTTASHIGLLEWGRCTRRLRKDGTERLYLHVFDWPQNARLTVPSTGDDLQAAQLLATGKALKFTTSANRITIDVPHEAIDKHATVIALDLAPTAARTQH